MRVVKKIRVLALDGRVLIMAAMFLCVPILASWIDSMERYFFGVAPGVVIAGEEVGKLLPDEVRVVVEEIAIKQQKLPVEPEIDKLSGAVISEQSGCVIDIDSNVKQIFEAGEGKKLKLICNDIYPTHRASEIQALDTAIARYETWVSGSSERISNITLAAESINNTLLWSGDIFSFNETVGPRTESRGYRPAPVIMMGSMEMGYGGGVCQVSSTVFNGAEKAGMKIIERHMHSKPVHYIPQGRDATVTYGYLDLKFENVLNDPVIIKCGFAGSKVWVEFMGREK